MKKRILSGVILLIGTLFVLLPGGTVNAASVAKTYKKAVSFYRKGNYTKAQKNLKKLAAYANESCVVNMSSDMEQTYTEILDTFPSKGDKHIWGYYLTDIDKDNSAELIIDYGSSQSDRLAYVYQYQSGQAITIGTFSSGHSNFYYNPYGNGVIGQRGIMGYESIYNIEIHSGKLKITYWKKKEREVKSGNYLYLPYALDDHTKYSSYADETYVDYDLRPVSQKQVSACPGVQELVEISEFNSNYSEYDLTGDRKADSFDSVIDRSDDFFSRCSLYINGKAVLSQNIYPAIGTKFYRIELKNGKVFLAVVAWTDNGDLTSAGIYQYKQRSLIKVASLDNNMKKIGFHNTVEDISVSGNTITVNYSICSHTLGGIHYQRKYQYKGGKLTASTVNSKITGWKKQKKWTAKMPLSVYNSVAAKKKISTIKKGEKIKIDRIYINKKFTNSYFRVKTSRGKIGWVKGNTRFPYPSVFKEAYYYG